jgi:hypothetical protein
MERDSGDILDRFCISVLKMERIGEKEAVWEFEYMKKGWEELPVKHPLVEWDIFFNEMLQYHKNIWDLESAVRKGALDHDHAEIGRRAIQIREWNKKRIELKNKVNEIVGEGVRDVRKNHLSQ